MLENLKECTYNITNMSAANYSRLLKWYQMKDESWYFNTIVYFTNRIYIFANINESIKQSKNNCSKN